MVLRQDRLKTHFKKLIAQFLQIHPGVNTLTTVTDFTISKDSHNATAFISVYPESKERETLNRIRKQKHDLWKYLAGKIKIKRIPSIEFKIDAGEKNRQRIEKLTEKR